MSHIIHVPIIFKLGLNSRKIPPLWSCWTNQSHQSRPREVASKKFFSLRQSQDFRNGILMFNFCLFGLVSVFPWTWSNLLASGSQVLGLQACAPMSSLRIKSHLISTSSLTLSRHSIKFLNTEGPCVAISGRENQQTRWQSTFILPEEKWRLVKGITVGAKGCRTGRQETEKKLRGWLSP